MRWILCSKRHLMILEDVDSGEKCKEGEGKVICLVRNGWRDFVPLVISLGIDRRLDRRMLRIPNSYSPEATTFNSITLSSD